MSQAEAVSKIILCGEHAVVYGVPAIAIPVSSLKVTVNISSTQDGFRIKSWATNEILTYADRTHPFVELTQRTFQALSLPLPQIEMQIHSSIPPASGLGSGAAVSTAIVRAIYSYTAHPYDNEAINALVFETEKRFHGTPSGIDNTVIVYEQPVYFIKGESIQTFQVTAPSHFLIANTGKPASTRDMVSRVRDAYNTQRASTEQIFEHITTITRAALTALKFGEHAKLGELLTKNHRLLTQLGVSSSELDQLVDTALSVGAYGAKLSGGGGGGNMIVLVAENQVAAITEALYRAGATHIIHTTLTPAPQQTE